MDNLTIITNNQPRLILEPYELTEAERADFDYLNWDAIERGEDSASFVRYKGELLDLGDLEAPTSAADPFPGWTAYRSDTFFSGVLIRFLGDDVDHVVMGRYYS